MPRLMCSQQWKLNSTNFGHSRQYRNMKHEPVLQMGTGRVVLKYDKCEWQKGFRLDIKGGLVWYTGGSKTNKNTGAMVCRWGIEGFIVSTFSCTPEYIRLEYIPLRLV